MNEQQQRNIALWLLVVCVFIFGMICLGGVTRLTGSGLSMVQWAPITGWLPPSNLQQWTDVFALYQASPEFIKINPNLDLIGFKAIFWFEYIHRLLGRSIGMVFFLPMAYFFIRYPLSMGFKLKLIALFLLGGAQGVLGWYMVQSGLINDPHVSQYRLVAHLALAVVLYCAIFWLASGYFVRNWGARYRPPAYIWVLSLIVFLVVFDTILAGGFVAGTRAGFAFNTFPLMNGHWIPEGYGTLSPWWKNWFENIAAVQFNHRALATVTILLMLLLWVVSRPAMLTTPIRRVILLLIILGLIQYSLGVATLLNVVPVLLASVHQASAIVVLTVSLLLLRGLSR